MPLSEKYEKKKKKTSIIMPLKRNMLREIAAKIGMAAINQQHMPA